MDTQACVYNISWDVLRAAKNLYKATHFLGGTAVTAPPFYDVAGRLNVLFWHSIPTRSTLDLEDNPLVMSLADFTENDFVEKYAPHLQHCQNWVILTPPLSKETKKKSFLDRYGSKISTGQGKVFRERGWWRSGQDKLASYATPLEGWVAKGQILDVGLISALTGALQNTALNEKPFLDDSILAHCYRQGTEMGLLGLHSIKRDIYATDGSLEGGKMGAGVYITRSSRALYCRVGRSCESRTSLRVETCASYLALEHGKDITAPIIILTDSANHLMELEEWVGPGKYPTLHTSKDGDIMRGVLELLHHRVSMGFPTFFVKVRAHKGEPFNEAADRIASMASEVDGAPLLWNAKSGRIIYQFAMDPSDLEAAPYSASMNDTVKKFIKSQAAVSDFYSSNSAGFVESFMRRPHSSRDLLGACLADSTFPDGAKKRLMQSVGLQFPCRALLHQWGKEDSPNCPFCKEKESLGHIQSRCKALEKPRISAHHMIWREILLQLLSLSGDEGDEHKWVVPSAVSTETHKELTIRQLLHHLGFFASDAVLENAVSAFFTKRSERASAYVNQHLRDPDDPSGLIFDTSSTTDLLDRVRFSSLILEGEKIRRCSTQELQTSVSAFLDLRPDGYAVHQKSKRLAILEFTRAMDSSDDWELQKDAEKRKRYAPVLEFFNSLPDKQGWSLLQFNFTVGVRGSISTEDRTDPLSFVSTLKALGISSRVNLEKIRKRVAKRTFEAHDLMLRSYYAVKFSSSSSVDFSRVLGNSFALQHCLRPPI
jgi:ribonuclease HI